MNKKLYDEMDMTNVRKPVPFKYINGVPTSMKDIKLKKRHKISKGKK